jgi:hypothetical protein
MSQRDRLADVLELIADELGTIRAAIEDPRNGLAAIRTKVDMVTDDHDEALARVERRLRLLEGPPNGHAA